MNDELFELITDNELLDMQMFNCFAYIRDMAKFYGNVNERVVDEQTN